MSKFDAFPTGKVTPTKSDAVKRNRQNKRALILDTASQLFAEFGYHATTMDGLSEHTGLNKGTLYYYYTTKPDILFDICVTTTDKHLEVVSAAATMPDPTEALNFIVETSVNYVAENRARCQVYYQEAHFFETIFDARQFRQVIEQQKKFMKNLYAVIRKGIACGQFRSVDERVCGRLMYASIMGLYRWRDPWLAPAAIISEAQNLLISGLRTHQDDR